MKIQLRKGCHGIPERCLTFYGQRMIICARCFGIRLGFVLGFVLFVYQINPPLLASALMILPTAIDGFAQMFWKRMSNNTRRFWTGLMAGTGFSSFVLSIGLWIFVKFWNYFLSDFWRWRDFSPKLW